MGVGFAMVANRLPQLIEPVRHRGVTGVSAGAWSISTCGSLLWITYEAGLRFRAAALVTCSSGAANVAIAALAGWRHHQSRQDMIREVIFAA